MLKRKAYDELLAWKNASKGSTALLIEGARRVGKSTLAREFGTREYKSCVFIDFNNAPAELRDIFLDNRGDLDTFFFLIGTYFDVDLVERDTLFVFDEVQMFPEARGYIKYLVEDGRYDYIETGSLLSIKQNVANIVLPSEERSLRLNPFDFEEFLWAMGEEKLAGLLRVYYGKKQPVPDAFHKKASRLLREYLLVGGMPAVVDAYARERDFKRIDELKRDILTLYRNDIGRFAGSFDFKVKALFDSIPAQLSKHDKRFVLSSLDKNARMRQYEEAFFWLQDSCVANLCFACTDPNVGYLLNADTARLKCYMADTGLLVSLAFADNMVSDETVYKAVLFHDLGLNEGMLVENLVAQSLVANGRSLFFYAKSDADKSKRMEIDFLITAPHAAAAGKPRVCPIEVKSTKSYSTVSLDRFSKAFGPRIGTEYVIHPGPLSVEGGRVYVPLYMAHLV
jgi:hypothetical protein